MKGAAPFYYACEHGHSNTPDACFPGAEPMPDDWHLTYVPSGEPGMTDSTNLT